jgi:hypothetical protein
VKPDINSAEVHPVDDVCFILALDGIPIALDQGTDNCVILKHLENWNQRSSIKPNTLSILIST